MQRLVEPDIGSDRRALGLRHYGSQSKARGSAAVFHALAQIECTHLGYRPRIRSDPPKTGRDSRVLDTFRRRDQHHAAVRPGKELTVEKISRDRTIEADFRLAHHDRCKRRTENRAKRRE